MSTREHPNDDHLLDLVLGLLPRPAAARTLDHLRGCVPCGARLRAFAGTHERAWARSVDALARANVVAPDFRPAPTRPMFARRTLAAAASVVVVGGAVLWAALQGTPPRLEVARLPVPDPSILTRGSAAPAIDDRLLEGLAAYQRQDLGGARRLLAGASATGPLEQVRLVYLGHAQLLAGDARAAAATLGGVDWARVPEPWQGEAQWALAEALARVGRVAAADSIRRLLAERPDAVGERAREALATPKP